MINYNIIIMSNSLATLLSSLITSKFKMDNMLYGPLHTTIENTINYITKHDFNFINIVFNYGYFIIFLVIIGGILLYVKKMKLMFTNYTKVDNKYEHIAISKSEIFKQINWYF